jgi:formylglycine-generating enzyme required for sulfatase activity
MGCLPGEEGCSLSEQPQHTVTFSSGFYISKYEITQRQWLAVMGTKPSRNRRLLPCATFDSPVDSVTWPETQEFMTALNEARPGRQYRLPSEAQWEYACRAGTTTRYYWGDDPDTMLMPDYAWVPENSLKRTHPVGQLEPNAWGIHDMGGNVWEWVQDYWYNGYNGAPSDGTAWEADPSELRVVRGGSYTNNRGCRSAFHGGYNPEIRNRDYGFRIVYNGTDAP